MKSFVKTVSAISVCVASVFATAAFAYTAPKIDICYATSSGNGNAISVMRQGADESPMQYQWAGGGSAPQPFDAGSFTIKPFKNPSSNCYIISFKQEKIRVAPGVYVINVADHQGHTENIEISDTIMGKFYVNYHGSTIPGSQWLGDIGGDTYELAIWQQH